MDFTNSFSFIGNQYRTQIEDKEYFIDLMPCNCGIQCLTVIKLKISAFLPEHKGKIELYLNILNDTVKLPHKNSWIGIIICKSKSPTHCWIHFEWRLNWLVLHPTALQKLCQNNTAQNYLSVKQWSNKLGVLIEITKQTMKAHPKNITN